MTEIPLPDKVLQFSEAVSQAGGDVYVTGGSVRDHLLGIASKDIDLEIHGLTTEQLEDILYKFPPFRNVGKSFGVWKLLPEHRNELEVDVAFPKHGDTPAPFMGVEEACRRRDLTINSMLIHVQTHQLIDLFDGLTDLKDRTLRATDEQCFAQDLLRVFRVCQFAGRLSCTVAPSLQTLCRTLVQQPEFKTLPKERVWVELQKAWMKSPEPHVAVEWLFELNVLENYFPQYSMVTEQDKVRIVEFCRQGSKFRTTNSPGRSMGLFLALLTHPLSTSETLSMLEILGIERFMGFQIKEAVLGTRVSTPLLTASHSTITQNICSDIFDIHFLCDVATIVEGKDDGIAHQNRLSAVNRDLTTPLPRLVSGKDLIALGLKGPEIGTWIDKVRTEQLHERIQSTEDALAWVKENR